MRSDKDIGMVSCSSVCCVMHFEPSLYPASFFDFSFFHLYNKDLVLCHKSTPPPGGLTQEHVEYVCDHMNHEDRGLVEFLDYLTYVPLFVEIHDNIYDNPLDFTRTK